MKKNEVQVGTNYIAKVSGKLTEVRITGESKHGGWDAVNVATKKMVRIKSAQRLRAAAGKPKAKADQPKTTEPAAPDAKPAASENPLLTAEASVFTELLGKATLEQLNEALQVEGLTAKKRSRIEAALKYRTTPRPAADVAKTVAAVEKGNLAEGVKVPMPAKRAGKAKAARAPKAKGKMSGLDAAAKVLAESPTPLNSVQIVEQAAAKGYWVSPGGRTPASTIYSAMLTNSRNGDQARFKKVDRGLWTLTDAGKAAAK